MTRLPPNSRRTFLRAGLGLGATFLAAPAIAASALDRRKFVVLICRGAMDGLSVSPPIGDANYQALRGKIAIPSDRALRLDSDFALHPQLQTLFALAQAGQARIAPAVAIPQRIRSHFEAQDVLENGGAALYSVSTGWLNRALLCVSSGHALGAISIGSEEPLVLRGAAPVQSWSPGGRGSAQTARIAAVLQDLYQSDPALGGALAAGLQTEASVETFAGSGGMQKKDEAAQAEIAGKFLAAEGGPDVAVLSLYGFDTHAAQGAETGQLANRLAVLDSVVRGLKDGLGSVWSQSVVIAVTEFGRTARINGTGGTDHGTASTLVVAGGALKPGGIVGDWPTLNADKLFEGRDLAPALDVRQIFKAMLKDHLGISQGALEARVFPDSRSAQPLRNLV